MVGITDEMIKAAHDFESAAIDAGIDHAKVTWDSAEWSITYRQTLRITVIDRENRTHTLEE